MLVCPQCGTSYTDNTLRFCLQDGAELRTSERTGMPTADYSETPTVVATRAAIPAEKKSSYLLPILAAAALLIIVVVIGAIAGWVYLSNRSVSNVGSNSANTKATPTPAPSRSPSVSPTPGVSPSPTLETPVAPAQNIGLFIDEWKSDTESGDIDALILHYADKVDYFRRSGVGKDDIRKDKARAFQMFDEIHFEISDLSFDQSPDNRTATVTFDKAWEFSGDKSSSGKVRSELKLRNDGRGRWLIVSEKDLKVYYTK